MSTLSMFIEEAVTKADRESAIRAEREKEAAVVEAAIQAERDKEIEIIKSLYENGLSVQQIVLYLKKEEKFIQEAIQAKKK